MGFRGEALASIAEVTPSQTADPAAGSLDRDTNWTVRGGIVKEPRACGCPAGTPIEIRQLFLNTPVRRKFLKTPSTEFGHIAEQFTRIALAHPNLQMTPAAQRQTRLRTSAHDADLLDRLELFFGSELAEQLIPVEAEHAGRASGAMWPIRARAKRPAKGSTCFSTGAGFRTGRCSMLWGKRIADC